MYVKKIFRLWVKWFDKQLIFTFDTIKVSLLTGKKVKQVRVRLFMYAPYQHIRTRTCTNTQHHKFILLLL